MRGLLISICIALCIIGCSGGGGSDPLSPVPAPVPPVDTPPAAARNVMSITIDAGPANAVNVPFVSVTLCSPGSTSNCQTIDHVIVDTGSSGLRVISSVLSADLNLPQRYDSSGNPLVECLQFADGYSWGPVKVADAQFGGESVTSLAIQVIGDPGFPATPVSCSTTGVAENTVMAFGGNGILGVGLFQQDCGSACAQKTPQPGFYYACSSGSCNPVAVALAQQVGNPVGLFATDNNGVAIVLPSVDAAGSENVSGALIFGIGTQSNNGLGNAAIFQVDPVSGTMTTKFNNRNYSSFIDSGSNALYFSDGFTAICTGSARGFYCPAATQQLTATIGANSNSGKVSFSVANADALFNNNKRYTSFNNLAGPVGTGLGLQTFDWGLPFFFGRTIFMALENRSTPAGNGPFYAY